MSQDLSEAQDRGSLLTATSAVKDAESLLGARRAEKTDTGEHPQLVQTESDEGTIPETPRHLADPDLPQFVDDSDFHQSDVDPETNSEQVEAAPQVTEKEPVSEAETDTEPVAAENALAPVAESNPEPEQETSAAAVVLPAVVAKKLAESDVEPEAETVSAEALTDARAKAMEDKPRLLKLRATLIAVAVPLAIFGLAARAVASSAFLWLEYHRPGFPADSYGFSTDDRMLYGSYGVNYILNFAPSTYLSELRVDSTTKLFLPTEVGHMTDVKHVMLAGMTLAIVMTFAGLISTKSLTYRSPGTIRKSLYIGSVLTLVAMITLGVLAALGWESFFTNFHHVLFPQGNWEFRIDDSLIRLYPPQFWVDAGIAFAVLAIALVALMLVVTWPTKNRRARVKLLRDFREQQRKLLNH